MPYQGVYRGASRPGWQEYTPALRGFISSGTPTQPVLGSATTFGRYLTKPSGLVTCQGLIQFASDTTFGSGETVWGIRLPVPANRISGLNDLPLGNAWAWQGTSANPQINVPLVPTLIDPLAGGGGNQSNEDYWVQFFCPYIIAVGTGTITSAATSVTITHGVDFVPNPYDILVTPTITTTSNYLPLSVQNCTATTFDVVVKSAPGASTLTFSWKLRGEPNGGTTLDLLANHLRPFAWASGHVLSWNFAYEARR